MRDDVSVILRGLIKAHDDKIRLLRELLATEHHLNSILGTDFDSEPVEIIESQNGLINRINLLDYTITSLEDNFQKTTGLPLSASFTGICREDSDCIKEVDIRRNQQKTVLKEIMKLRDINTGMMEKIKSESLKDADELKRIMELDPDFHR